MDSGIGDDPAWLGTTPGTIAQEGPSLSMSCPAGEAVPMRVPFQGGTAYRDPEGHVPHPGAVKVHPGEPVSHQQIDSKEQEAELPT